jgi:hypothetical protein
MSRRSMWLWRKMWRRMEAGMGRVGTGIRTSVSTLTYRAADFCIARLGGVFIRPPLLACTEFRSDMAITMVLRMDMWVE